MSLELSGTTGVKGVAGSVAAPSIVGDDTNTGISFPAADTIKFSTGGVERMSITNSGVSGVGGKILQVVQTVKKDRFSTSSASFIDITGMSVTITPTKASSKILITSTGITGANGDQAYHHCRVNRSIAGGSFDDTFIIGDLSNAETRSSIDMSIGRFDTASPLANTRTFAFEFLDSPSYSLGNAIIYKLQVKTTNTGTSGAMVFGGSGGTGDYNGRSAPCFLTVKEVAT